MSKSTEHQLSERSLPLKTSRGVAVSLSLLGPAGGPGFEAGQQVRGPGGCAYGLQLLVAPHRPRLGPGIGRVQLYMRGR